MLEWFTSKRGVRRRDCASRGGDAAGCAREVGTTTVACGFVALARGLLWVRSGARRPHVTHEKRGWIMSGMSAMDVVLVFGTIGFLIVMPFAVLAWTLRRASAESTKGQQSESS